MKFSIKNGPGLVGQSPFQKNQHSSHILPKWK